MSKSFFNKNDITEHFSKCKNLYIITVVTLIISIIIGIVLSFGDFNYLSILNSSDNKIFDLIIGDFKPKEMYYLKLKNILLFFMIIFLLNTNVYSSFLSFVYLGYQFLLFVFTCIGVVNLNGFVGLINVVFLLIPINLIYYFIMVVFNCVLVNRAFVAYKYRYKFLDSFKSENVLRLIIVCFILSIIVCFVYSYIVPLFIKSLVFVVY